jgi:hypothetical protein
MIQHTCSLHFERRVFYEQCFLGSFFCFDIFVVFFLCDMTTAIILALTGVIFSPVPAAACPRHHRRTVGNTPMPHRHNNNNNNNDPNNSTDPRRNHNGQGTNHPHHRRCMGKCRNNCKFLSLPVSSCVSVFLCSCISDSFVPLCSCLTCIETDCNAFNLFKTTLLGPTLVEA